MTKKKDKKAAPRPKEFSATPFAALKGLRPAEEPPAKPAAVKAPETERATGPVAEPDDSMLFLRAVADVRRLEPPAPRREKEKREQAPPAQKVSEKEQQVFLEAVGKMQLDVTFQDELPDDVKPLRPLATNRLRELKRGAIRIDLELDLHGLTREEALESLGGFIAKAYARGQKAVLVITGKGNNSPGEPVLVGAVSSWLREQGKVMVAEFSPAPRQLGGSGAFVVFLKDKVKAGDS